MLAHARKQKVAVMDTLPLMLQEELARVVNSGAFAQVCVHACMLACLLASVRAWRCVHMLVSE
jgi:hypothetical protein